MTTADTAAVASAGAAAFAAVASWVSVMQSSRIQRRALEPRLHIQVSQRVTPGYPNLIRVRVENTGGGFAHEVMFWVKEGPEVCLGGVPPHAALGPGQGTTIDTALTPSGTQATAVVIWKYGKKVYAQSAAPARRGSWSRRKWAFWAPKNSDAVVHRLYPDAGSLDSWTLVKYEESPGSDRAG